MQEKFIQYVDKPMKPMCETSRMSKKWYDIAKTKMKGIGVSPQNLADRMGIGRSTVGHWLTGRRSVSFETLKKIASIIDLSVVELAGEDMDWVTKQDERQWLAIYRAMSTEEKAVVIKMLSSKKTD